MRLPEERRAASEPNDGDVVLRVLGGERDAFRILVQRYQDLLFRHSLRMTGDSDVAADLVQAAFIKAYSNLAFCRDQDRFGAWLFRILANGCKDHLKSRRRRDVSLDDDVVQPIAPSNPHRELERAETRGLVQAALDKLPVAMREAFVLKHVEGLSYEEIAGLTGTSIPALKMRVHRARELLQRHIGPQEG